jgi:hypothetical protein
VERAKWALKRPSADIPKKVRQAFVESIERGNIPSFDDRIEEILIGHPGVAYLVADSASEFARTVAENRRNLTGEEMFEDFTPAAAGELRDLTRRLGRLFYLCMLDELELDAITIGKILLDLDI